MARIFVLQDVAAADLGQCALCAYPLGGRAVVAADRPEIAFCVLCFARCVDAPGGLQIPAQGMRVYQVDRRGVGFARG